MKKQPSLAFCLIMDFIGYSTYALPLIGEFADVIWAPISATIYFMAWGGKKGALGGLFNFAEELLPFLDFIPTFTITWAITEWQKRKKPAVAGLSVTKI